MKTYKVICVDNLDAEDQLSKGGTYTVTYELAGDRLQLKGIYGWFYINRFTKIDNSEAEETFFTRHILPNQGTAESLIRAFEKEFTDYHLFSIENNGRIELHSREMIGIAGQSFIKGFLAGIP